METKQFKARLNALAFWLLLAPLLPQALWVKRTAPRFGGAPGPRSGSVGQGSPFRLVGLGDSIIDGVGCSSLDKAMIGACATGLSKALDCRVEWQAYGKAGLRTRSILRRMLPQAELEDSNFVLISTGVNDVTALTRPDIFGHHLDELLQAVCRRAPHAHIVICGLPPMQQFPALPFPLKHVLGLRARTLDCVMAERVHAFERVVRVPIASDLAADDFAADGYHPSEHSCSALAGPLVTALLESCGDA